MAAKKGTVTRSASSGQFVPKSRVVSARVASGSKASTVRNASKRFAAKKKA